MVFEIFNNIKKKNGNGYPNPYEKAREWIEKDYNPEQITELILKDDDFLNIIIYWQEKI